jgi:nucleotide-binding universal stress UspA family protein
MFKRILVPLDNSKLAECVLPHLVAIARIGEPEVLLLRVLEPFDGLTHTHMIDPVEWQIRKAEAESYLSSLAAVLQEAGLQVSIRLEEGRPAERIIEASHIWDADLILMSSHGKGGLSPWSVSSVVERVSLLSHRSVMIVRAYQPVKEDLTELRYKKIMLPLDGSQRAELPLSVAEALAREHDSKLLVAHIIQQPQPPRRTSSTQEDYSLIRQLTERSQEEALKYMNDLKSRLAVEFEMKLEISPEVKHALHQIVDEQEVDLTILCAHGYSGDTRWPYGSVVTGFIVYGSTTLLILQDLPGDRIEPTRAEIAARDTESR